MNSFAKALTVVGAGLLLGGNASAVIPDKYQTILDRNPFGLLPPAPPQDPEEQKVEPPANLKFTGIATIGGERRVYFTIPPKDPKDVQRYIHLSEGQRDGSLEVIAISEADEEVRIRNGNVDMTLSLKKDGFQPAKLPPGVNAAPMPVPSPLGQAPGAQAASPVYNANAGTGSASIQQAQQSNNGRFAPPQPQPINNPQPTGGGSVQPASNGSEVRTIPTRTLRVPPVQPSNPQSSFNSGGNSVVHNPNPSHNNGGNNGGFDAPAIDPALQIASMKEYQNMVDRNGGYVPVTVPNRQTGPVAQPPTSTRYIPAPPMPPMPY